MRLLLIADTHVPKRARDLPARVWDEVSTADVVMHAGDWVEPALLDTLEARAKRLVACWGNNDGAELRRRLPERADVTLGGLRFTVVHETGAATGREARMAKEYPDTDVLVFGHSHIPWDTTAKTGLRLLNPGSPTDRRRQPFCTYMTATVDDAALGDVVLHRLDAPMRDRAARVADVHEIAASMPHVTRIEGPKGNAIYQVGGKSFVFFRTPQPDARGSRDRRALHRRDHDLGRVGGRQAGAHPGPELAVLHHRPFRRVIRRFWCAPADYARSAGSS